MSDEGQQRVCEHGRPEKREGEVARDSLQERGDQKENVRTASDGQMSEEIARSQERTKRIEGAETGLIGMMVRKSERR